MNKRAEELIRLLDLSPHPEGGYFKEVYRADGKVLSPCKGQMRSAVTDIYFLLLSGQVSRFHRVVHDEIWHFYEGDPLELLEVHPEIHEITKVVLESKGQFPSYKYCVKGGNWQAAYTTGDYSLVGCTVAPGFDFADFEFLEQNVLMQSTLLKKYPDLIALI